MNVDNDGRRAKMDTENESNDKDETRREITNENPLEKEDGRQPNTMDMTSEQEFTNNSPEEGHGGDVMDAASEVMTDPCVF